MARFSNCASDLSLIHIYNASKAAKFSDAVLKNNAVKCVNRSQIITGLSGGNIQKIIIGRSVAVKNVKLLVLDEPTNGMDSCAKLDVCLLYTSFFPDGPKVHRFSLTYPEHEAACRSRRCKHCRLPRILPVSYTHLDVYKRQAQCDQTINASDNQRIDGQ